MSTVSREKAQAMGEFDGMNRRPPQRVPHFQQAYIEAYDRGFLETLYIQALTFDYPNGYSYYPEQEETS